MSKYEHVISLGFFCSTALELDKIGLRDSSGPFDWLISDFKGVLDCIDDGFEDLLNYNNMSQYKAIPNYYVDNKYKLHFYHDFSQYTNLKDQLPDVTEKYKRRIARFQQNIKEPTLFIRYIENQEEIDYIEKNYNDIISLLKRYNDRNDLILISNDDIVSSLQIFKVKKDDNDSVARSFLDKNSELKEFLLSDIYNQEKRMSNIRNYEMNQKKEGNEGNYQRILNKAKKLFKKPYAHHLIFDE